MIIPLHDIAGDADAHIILATLTNQKPPTLNSLEQQDVKAQLNSFDDVQPKSKSIKQSEDGTSISKDTLLRRDNRTTLERTTVEPAIANIEI